MPLSCKTLAKDKVTEKVDVEILLRREGTAELERELTAVDIRLLRILLGVRLVYASAGCLTVLFVSVYV